MLFYGLWILFTRHLLLYVIYVQRIFFFDNLFFVSIWLTFKNDYSCQALKKNGNIFFHILASLCDKHTHTRARVHTYTYTHICVCIYACAYTHFFVLLKLILCTFYSIYFYTIFLLFTSSPWYIKRINIINVRIFVIIKTRFFYIVIKFDDNDNDDNDDANDDYNNINMKKII